MRTQDRAYSAAEGECARIEREIGRQIEIVGRLAAQGQSAELSAAKMVLAHHRRSLDLARDRLTLAAVTIPPPPMDAVSVYPAGD